MPSQLRKLALIEEGSPDTVVTFSVVQEGAAEASRQVLSIEPSDNIAVIENDRELVTAKDYDITVVGLYTNATDKSQLGTWQQNQTNLKWAGIGLKDQLILQGEGPLKFQEDYEDNVSFRFNSPRTATGNYSTTTGKHTAELSYSKNGLALFKWGDANGDGIADGWVTGHANPSFSGGQQSLDTTLESGFQNFTETVYLPFTGEQVTFSLNYVSSTGTFDIQKLEIGFFDAAGSSISSPEQSVTSGGRVSLTTEIPSSAVLLECRFVTSAPVGGGGTSVISDPALNLGTSTEFNEFYT